MPLADARRPSLVRKKPIEVAIVWMTRARSVLSFVVLSAAATLGSVGPAQAALYTGKWDPAYGGIFANLGWEASAVFDVPNACLALGSSNDHPISGACAGFDVLSAQVRFYDIANPSLILGTYNLNPNVIVNGIDIAGSQLTGIDSGFFDFFVPALSIAGGGTYSFSLILFDSDMAQLIYANPLTASPICGYTHFGNTTCGISETAATGVFAPIPEPETYVLMLAGLGALALARRRRSR
jgi:hypothetical protein